MVEWEDVYKGEEFVERQVGRQCELMARWCSIQMVGRSGGVVEWWRGGVVTWWRGGVVAWWRGCVVASSCGGVVAWCCRVLEFFSHDCLVYSPSIKPYSSEPVSFPPLRTHETTSNLICLLHLATDQKSTTTCLNNSS